MKHRGTILLETDRLILRPFCLEDFRSMYDNWASDPEVTRFLTWPTHDSPGISRCVLKFWLEEYAKPAVYQWAIVPKDLGQPIGSITAVQVLEHTATAEIGYCIGRNWWRMGYTSEALKAVIDFFFTEVGFNRIQARHDPRNPGSGAVMAKCGMKYEGTLRQAGRNNQGICDEVFYAILREEYNP